ncbi:aminotransferase class III-fold pyridoxal phosphate-dependent enzyme [bacterium]|nr:aminotransferase class III-fold pyridoxal phosphate-dependent enzyme [bacterium]
MKLENSLRYQERAKSRIPGVTQLLSKRPDQFSLGVWPGYYKKAKGVEIWDLDDNRYIDMSIGGIGANVLGYADDDVDNAVMEAIKNGSSSSLNCPEEIELADLLCQIHPWADMARFSRTGGEAMAIAVRIARAYTGKDVVAFCGYHGWHDWYLAANLQSKNALGQHLLSGLNPNGVPKGLMGTSVPFQYNKIEELQKIVSDRKNEIAAIVLEPIRSEKPIPGFLESVRQIADEIGAVLIVDEISSGLRLNSGGAHLVLNLEPDISVFSKALGNGYPISAIIGKGPIMRASESTFISSTNWTERTGSAAAIACLKKHEKLNVGEHLVLIGDLVQKGWQETANQHGLKISVNGISPLSHFQFGYDNALVLKAYFIQLMMERGFLASNLFYAMAAHSKEHVAQYIVAINSTFEIIAADNEQGIVPQKLKGRPSNPGFKRLT